MHSRVGSKGSLVSVVTKMAPIDCRDITLNIKENLFCLARRDETPSTPRRNILEIGLVRRMAEGSKSKSKQKRLRGRNLVNPSTNPVSNLHNHEIPKRSVSNVSSLSQDKTGRVNTSTILREISLNNITDYDKKKTSNNVFIPKRSIRLVTSSSRADTELPSPLPSPS